jgi:hypothetical protein
MRSITRTAAIIGGLCAVALVLSGCATQPTPRGGPNVPGFFYGLLHGFGSPVALVAGFFVSDSRVYAFPNSGWWYDLGFMIGLLPWAGGGATAASR